MIVTIKLVDALPKSRRGEFAVTGTNTCEILISKQRNQTLGEFAATFLHELLHLWVTVLENHGIRAGIRREHNFIRTALPRIIRSFNYWYKEK